MSNTWAEEMVYKYHKEIQNLTKERNQLEQQLKEKDNKIQVLEKQRNNYRHKRNEYRKQLKPIKKQLAEKNQIIKEMKNCEYVFDIKANVIKKIYYDEEKNYMVESMAPLGIFKELEKLQQENADLESKLAEKEKENNILYKSLLKISTQLNFKQIKQLKEKSDG